MDGCHLSHSQLTEHYLLSLPALLTSLVERMKKKESRGYVLPHDFFSSMGRQKMSMYPAQYQAVRKRQMILGEKATLDWLGLVQQRPSSKYQGNTTGKETDGIKITKKQHGIIPGVDEKIQKF